MRRSIELLLFVNLAFLPIASALGDIELRSPGSPASKVTKDGTVVEPWGSVRLVVIEPENAATVEPRAEETPMPTAVTSSKAGPITLTQSAFRAPIWPSGIDVLEASLTNSGEDSSSVCLELVVPEAMEVGESTGTVEGKRSLALPAGLVPIREERAWGYVDGVSALPGWAKPSVPCDSAFKNIAAGMGGVPIRYRFKVEPGGKRTVVLGFSESHHPTAGLRPLVAQVEGTEDRIVDPVASWGRHVPGVLRFDAVDANADGRLEVAVVPHPQARDRNPILNVIWVFDTAQSIDEQKLIAGEANELAEHYVDVGGRNDQGFYKPGNLRFALELQPKEVREFFLLLRSPGCPYLPDLSEGLWDKETLRKAAADVWRDRWEEEAVAEGAGGGTE